MTELSITSALCRRSFDHSTLLTGELRCREAKELSPGHRAGEGQGWDVNGVVWLQVTAVPPGHTEQQE